jgi:hypothetical protein
MGMRRQEAACNNHDEQQQQQAGCEPQVGQVLSGSRQTVAARRMVFIRRRQLSSPDAAEATGAGDREALTLAFVCICRRAAAALKEQLSQLSSQQLHQHTSSSHAMMRWQPG